LSEEEFSNESLKKSMEKVGQLYEVIVAEDGEVLEGKHRKEVDPNWPTKTVSAKTKIDKILVRMHAHHRRRVPKEETQALMLELAREVESSGIPKENISSELAKRTPYSEQYIRELLPSEYKKPEKVEAAKVGALLTAQKEAQIEEKPLEVAVPCSGSCHTNTKFPHYVDGKPYCSVCFGKLSRGEPLEKPVEAKPTIEEAPKPPRMEKKIYEPSAWKEEMHKPVSRMDEFVRNELIRRGYRIRSQEPICIKFVVPEVIVDGLGEKSFEKPFALFLDTAETHGKHTLVDMENRELLAKRGIRVLEIQYESYTEEQRQLVMSEITSAI